jgi:sterol desaturase/sphingolipid hydroxylase (fatty acid hydroxylase superfamily)
MPKNYISNKDETVRMFKSNFMESLSHVHWSVPLWIYLPVISFLFYRSIIHFDLSLPVILLQILFGIVIWTITEYTLHRFIFHYEPKSNFGKRIHFIVHGVHHDYPKDSRRLVMPPSVSIPLALFFYFLFYQILGDAKLQPFFAGFLIGYLFYDITHYAIHHYNTHNRFWLAIKNHHMKHHYQDSNKGFGVSQPTWDYVFKTDFTQKEQG